MLRCGGWPKLNDRTILATATKKASMFSPEERDRLRSNLLEYAARDLFGVANGSQHAPPPLPGNIIGLAWLYALHARSCIARRKLWQAEYMISGVRDNALALACIRHGLPAVQGRGMDLLPNGMAEHFEDSLVRQLNTAELSRAFRVVIYGLLGEISCVDKELAARLREVFTCLIETLC